MKRRFSNKKSSLNVTKGPNMTSTTLIHAITSQDLEVVEEHLKFGVDVNECDKEGFFPLYVALLLSYNVEMIKLLLKNKANAKWRDYFGTPMLQRALLSGKKEGVKLLLEHIAFEEDWPESVKFEISTNIFDFLLKRMHDFNLDKTNFPTVLQFMILHDEDLAMELLDGNIPFELNALNFDYGDDVTLINVAVRYASSKIVQKLIELEVEVDKKYCSVKSPLELAIERGDSEIIRLLLSPETLNSSSDSIDFLSEADFDWKDKYF